MRRIIKLPGAPKNRAGISPLMHSRPTQVTQGSLRRGSHARNWVFSTGERDGSNGCKHFVSISNFDAVNYTRIFQVPVLPPGPTRLQPPRDYPVSNSKSSNLRNMTIMPSHINRPATQHNRAISSQYAHYGSHRLR